MLKKSLLIIDDEDSIIRSVESIFSSEGYHFLSASNGKQGLRLFSQQLPSVVAVDYKMPGMNGLEFIRAAKTISPDTPIIVMTAFGNKELDVLFLKEGAFRYIEKPFDIDEFKLTIDEAFQNQALINENRLLQNIIQINSSFPEIIGSSPAMGAVFNLINQVAYTDATVLIEGESGTGKELVAKAIHDKSENKHFPFIRFNCAALPENLAESELFGHERGAFTGADKQKIGRFELAQNGTIFLDEVGELSPKVQAKFLRVLQEKEYERVGGSDVLKTTARVIAATNRDLKQMVFKKEFRQDLYYRLTTFPITVPPLRERGQDIEQLAQHFFVHYKKKYDKNCKGFTPQALRLMMHYPWHGNVRELDNIISRAVIICEQPLISDNHLLLDSSFAHSLLEDAFDAGYTERQLVQQYAQLVYKKCNYNKKQTSDWLDINYRTLQSRLQGADE